MTFVLSLHANSAEARGSWKNNTYVQYRQSNVRFLIKLQSRPTFMLALHFYFISFYAPLWSQWEPRMAFDIVPVSILSSQQPCEVRQTERVWLGQGYLASFHASVGKPGPPWSESDTLTTTLPHLCSVRTLCTRKLQKRKITKTCMCK